MSDLLSLQMVIREKNAKVRKTRTIKMNQKSSYISTSRQAMNMKF